MLRAVRRDDGAAVTALTAAKLLSEISADYRARPVPRETPTVLPVERASNQDQWPRP